MTAPTPPSGGGVVPGAAPTLSRDLSDFLIELSIALHKHAIYPPGHPLLASAEDGVTRKLTSLMLERHTLSIGVARRQLIIEGVATDPSHPLLQELASRLHRHHLGAVKFASGITRDELGDALATLAVDAGRMDRPLGLNADEVSRKWDHVRIFPLTYEKLELLEEDPNATESAPEGQMRAGRAAQLWVGLARAALAADATADATDDTSLEPSVVAQAIDQHQRETAYDQVIVGYLLQIADELKASKGAETIALQKRISRMVESLHPDTLERLLEMGGDAEQRRRFVLDASQGMTVDAVVELIKAAAEAEQQTISTSLMRLFTKLAKHADYGDTTRRAMADTSVRDQVLRLMAEWSLDDPNPGAYSAVLEAMARSAPSRPHSAIPTECEPERIVQMGLEVGVYGPRVEHAVRTMLQQGRVAKLLDLIDDAPNAGVGDRVWAEVDAGDPLRAALGEPRVDMVLVERLVHRKRRSAIVPLLDGVEFSDDTKLREGLIELLAWIGDDVGPEVLRRLPSSRPALQRDFLALLGRLSSLPPGFEAAPYLMHPEALVRREAVRLMLRDPVARDATLIAGLTDPDDRTVFLALNAAQEKCPLEAIPIIRERVDRGELDAPLRALGIRAVAARRNAADVPWLLARVVMHTKWLRRMRLAPKSPEMLASLGALAAYWPNEAIAKPAIALAAKSRDADIRQAASGQRMSQVMAAVQEDGER